MRDGEEGFAAFYADHYPGVWAYLLRLGAEPALASDVAQETFVRWLERKPAVIVGSARAYLYRTALNLYIDQYRRRRREIAWDAEVEESTASFPDEGPDSLSMPVWSRLSARQRQLLWLAYAEGFSHDEIAAITGLAAEGIRVLLARARSRFAMLQAQAEGKHE